MPYSLYDFCGCLIADGCKRSSGDAYLQMSTNQDHGVFSEAETIDLAWNPKRSRHFV
ncbi:MAG: hypothetical protein JW755_06130 [Candidatus Aminicenantes bacterium]|nr:hypothetical protein [Candidatus Aminicenantes bacterium]